MMVKGYAESLDSAVCSNDGACNVNWGKRSWRCRALSSENQMASDWVECEPVNTKPMVELNETLFCELYSGSHWE